MKKKADFVELFRCGKMVGGNYLNLFFYDASERKVGFVVSKKIRRAVQRNRAKRILRELYRTHRALFPMNKKFILLAKNVDKKIKFAQLQRELLELLKRMGNDT